MFYEKKKKWNEMSFILLIKHLKILPLKTSGDF